MAFSSGTFSLVAGNPVVTGTTVSSTWANNTLTDIATGLSTCILKDGTQTTTAPIPIPNLSGNTAISGSATATAFIPSSSTVPTNGMFLSAANTIGWATNSTSSIVLNAFGTLVIGRGASLATNATEGYIYIPNTTGTPTGVPTTNTGSSPMQVDIGANKLWVYTGAAWRWVQLT